MNYVDLIFFLLVGCMMTSIPTLILVWFFWRLIDEF